jgi:hypothetical protein
MEEPAVARVRYCESTNDERSEQTGGEGGGGDSFPAEVSPLRLISYKYVVYSHAFVWRVIPKGRGVQDSISPRSPLRRRVSASVVELED